MSFILAHGKFQESTQFDMMCECEKYINWQKDMLGLGGGGAHLEINYKIVN